MNRATCVQRQPVVKFSLFDISACFNVSTVRHSKRSETTNPASGASRHLPIYFLYIPPRVASINDTFHLCHTGGE